MIDKKNEHNWTFPLLRPSHIFVSQGCPKLRDSMFWICFLIHFYSVCFCYWLNWKVLFVFLMNIVIKEIYQWFVIHTVLYIIYSNIYIHVFNNTYIEPVIILTRTYFITCDDVFLLFSIKLAYSTVFSYNYLYLQYLAILQFIFIVINNLKPSISLELCDDLTQLCLQIYLTVR